MKLKETFMNTFQSMLKSQFKWPLIILFFIMFFNLIFTPNFFDISVKDGHFFGSLIDILNRATPVIIMAIGMTLVIGTGGIDISVGSVMAISSATAGYLITKGEYSMAAIIFVPVIIASLFGLWNGILVSVFGVQPIVVTLILLVAGRGVAELITDGQILVFERPAFEFIGNGFLFGLPFPVTIFVVLGLFVYFVTRRGALGLFIEAVGGNAISSRYAGINDRVVKIIVYVFSAFCAGISGLIATANIKAADPHSCGLGLELDAILAVAIGGTLLDGGKFSVKGTVIGAIIMQSLTTTILMRGIPVQATLIVKSIVVVIVCLLQSENFRIIMKKLFSRRPAGA